MELASRLRWAGIILGFLLVLILLGWGMYTVARNVFDSNSNSTTSVVSEEVQYEVESTGEAVLYVSGPTVASEDHRSYKITIRPSTVTMTVFKDYGQEAIETEGYINSNSGYRAFLSALAKLDVTSRVAGTDEDTDYDEAGACATGKTYILELDNDIRRWSTSCSSRAGGTAGFDMTSVRRLFERQVPDFRNLTRGTGL